MFEKRVIIFIVMALLLITTVYSHSVSNENSKQETGDYLPISYGIIIFTFCLIPLTIFLTRGKLTKNHILFLLIIFFVGVITLLVVADTVYITLTSETKGPVHWHADFQMWNCNERIDLIDPTGIANRVGTRLLHEHNDNRIHVEGILKEINDVDLHNFFSVIKGELTETSFSVLTNDGIVKRNDGELCNGEEGEVQIFVYKILNPDAKKNYGFEAEQIKVNEDYVLSPYQDVPPGDCIIIEFDKRKDKTDKICETYGLAIEQNRIEVVG